MTFHSKYIVLDNTGSQVGPVFHSYKEAYGYKIYNHRLDWRIKLTFNSKPKK